MKRARPFGLLLALAGAANAQPAGSRTAVEEGIGLEFSAARAGSTKAAGGSSIREGDDVLFRFTITDAATGNRLSGLLPAAWLKFGTGAEPADRRECIRSVAQFATGSLLTRPAVDLNGFYVLTLNDDASISVVDPLFGYGGSKLLTMVPLASPGGDWALTSDQNRLFVSMPDANSVAEIDTSSWKAVRNIDAGPHPTRVILQPDEHYLWVSTGSYADHKVPGGVAVISTDTMEPAAQIATGEGPHEIVLSSDNRFAFVANAGEGTVSIIDVRTLHKMRDLPTGREPISIAFSALSQRAYITHRDGSIVVLDGATQERVASIRAEPGIEQIRFAPGGRLALVANPEKNAVHIIDAASNRIVQSAPLPNAPEQISFSERFAYVRPRDRGSIIRIALDGLGTAGEPVNVVAVDSGQNVSWKIRNPTPASAIAPAAGENGILAANPSDKTISYYEDGMLAPMGSFTNYSREPRGVLVVDRSLRQRSPGVYETIARVGRAGQFEVAFFLNSPRVVQCFEMSVDADPVLEAKRRSPVNIEPLIQPEALRMGDRARLRFRLTDPATHEPKAGLRDVQIVTFLASGTWQATLTASAAEDGIYEIEFTPPQPGLYRAAVACRSLGLTFEAFRPATLEVKGK